MSVKIRNKQRNDEQTTSGEQHRRCLMCGTLFLSFGSGNRVCKKCKSTQAWREG